MSDNLKRYLPSNRRCANCTHRNRKGAWRNR